MNTPPTTAPRGASLALLYVGFIAGQALGFLPPNLEPLTVGVFAESFGLNHAQTGVRAMAELLCVAFGALATRPFLGRLPVRPTLFIAASLLVAANLASAFSTDLTLLFVARCIGGIAAGVILAFSSAAPAIAERPHKIVATNMVVAGIIYTVIFYYAALLAADGPQAYFLFMAGVSALLLVPCLGLKRMPEETVPVVGQRRIGPDGIILLIIAIVGAFALGSAWSFAERFAANLGAEPEQISVMFAAQSVVGIAAGVTAWFAISPKHILTAVGLSFAGTIFGHAGLALAPTVDIYFAALGLSTFAYIFFFAAMLSWSYQVDPSGRLGILTTSSIIISESIAPGIAGPVAQYSGDLANIGYVILVVGTITGGLAFNAARLRQQRAAT